ncbi:MAG: RloB family protein [Methanosarcina vacuolata]|jgi:hypothetical protein|nr:RloB family protein [Methanosarcina vacuolata]
MSKKYDKLRRKEGTRNPIGNVYIICEGEKTEYKYFSSFKSEICKGRECCRKKLSRIEVVPSKNCSILANIKFARNYAKAESICEKDGDCVICIVDCDANRKSDFDKGIKLAKGNKYNIKVNLCLSNPSFEIWYLLHYECYKKHVDQYELEKRLKQHIKNYEKNIDYYYLLENYMDKAKEFANELKGCHSKKGIDLLSYDSNPSTMVPYFLEHIQNFIEK